MDYEDVYAFFGKLAQSLSQGLGSLRASLLGNGMDKVYIEALKLFETLPEKERNYDNLFRLFQSGIIKTHEGNDIRILLAHDRDV